MLTAETLRKNDDFLSDRKGGTYSYHYTSYCSTITTHGVSYQLATSSAIPLRHNLKFCNQLFCSILNSLTYWTVHICGNAPCGIPVLCLSLSTCWTRSIPTCACQQVLTLDWQLSIPATAHCCISLQHRTRSAVPDVPQFIIYITIFCPQSIFCFRKSPDHSGAHPAAQYCGFFL